MTYLPDDLAPGCYGSALAFKDTAAVCMACPFNSRCQPLHVEALTAIRERLGITAASSAPRRKSTSVGLGGKMALGEKAKVILEKLEARNLRITERLAKGENPFKGENLPVFMIAAHLLLNLAGGLRREQLSMAYAAKLQCQADTAASYARQTIQILEAIGAVDVNEGIVSLRRVA